MPSPEVVAFYGFTAAGVVLLMVLWRRVVVLEDLLCELQVVRDKQESQLEALRLIKKHGDAVEDEFDRIHGRLEKLEGIPKGGPYR